MIDDFRGGTKPPKKDRPEEEEFFPDLSTPEETPATTPASEPTPQENAMKPAEQQPELDADDTIELDNTTDSSTDEDDKKDSSKPKIHWWHKSWAWFKALDKKQKALFIIAIVIFIAGLSTAAYALLKPEPAPKPVVKTKPAPPEPTTVPNTLTGRQVQPEINERQVIGVMIENSREARPQSGIQEAGVVFEAIAEGGITRFLTLYQDTEPSSIGPIRSARPYYVSWAMGFDAALAHVGGSPEALQNIRSWGTKDLDQFSHPGSFSRVTDRYAPHNMYSSYDRLSKLAAEKKYDKSTFDGFDRTEKGKPAKTPTARTVNVNISSANYNSAYTYAAESNTYARTMAGVAHKDGKSGKQITPDVVVVMVTSYGIKSNGIHSIYGTTGTGKVFVFQNGTVTEGTWQKQSNEDALSFKDSGGRALKLNPGQTWITAISSADKVTYQP